MTLRKERFLRLKTEPGQVEWVTGIFFILFLGAFLCLFLQLEIYKSSSRALEDALAASNLASAVIDVEEYGRTHRVWIEPWDAYTRYRTAVKGNLGLNEAWECESRSHISGPVRVTAYSVYNVSGNDVIVSSFDENGNLTERQEKLGSAAAPNGKMIENTGVYSEIRYRIEGMQGTVVEAQKGKLVDIVAESK